MQLIPLGRRAREAADREKAEAAAKERAERGTKRKREALAQKKTQTRSNLRRLVDALRVVFPEGSKCDTLPSAHSVSLICRLLEEIRPELNPTAPPSLPLSSSPPPLGKEAVAPAGRPSFLLRTIRAAYLTLLPAAARHGGRGPWSPPCLRTRLRGGRRH